MWNRVSIVDELRNVIEDLLCMNISNGFGLIDRVVTQLMVRAACCECRC